MGLRSVGLGAVLLCVSVSGAACKEEPPAPPLNTLKPTPLPQLEGAGADGGKSAAELSAVEVATVFGEAVPSDAVRAELLGEKVTLGGAPFDAEAKDASARIKAQVPSERGVLIVPDADTFLAQATAFLAALDDARVRTWLVHPDGTRAFRITLSDERDFTNWLDEPRPSSAGRIRIIYRADGYELQTSLGKLPGGDPNGPTVPRRNGQYDIAKLRTALGVLKRRFETDRESCIVPSFGMELSQVAASLTAYYPEDDARYFDAVCLVYPRPREPVADGGVKP